MEHRIQELEMGYSELLDRVDYLEFRTELLAEESNISSFLLECRVNRKQYRAIMDVMEKFRGQLDRGEKVSNWEFEQEIKSIFKGDDQKDYHFCELVAMSFMEDGRWEEVFPALYGDMPKYKD